MLPIREMLDKARHEREIAFLSSDELKAFTVGMQKINTAVATLSRRRTDDDQWIFEASEPDPRNMLAPTIRETVERSQR